jgi:low affinity Fe/Cu permease
MEPDPLGRRSSPGTDMAASSNKTLAQAFATFAGKASKAAGKPYVFFLCALLVLLWALTGPIAGFSDTWQLVINTSTTIITFLMVFLIQSTQNRDSAAIQAKLDELIRVSKSDNEFIGIEHLDDEELDAILSRVEKSARGLHAEQRARRTKKERSHTSARRAKT